MATRQELIDRRTALEGKLESLEDLYDRIIETGLVQEYHYNDGQNIVKTIYRTPEQLTSAINGLETRINKLTHKINGRFYVARDSDSRRY